MPEIHTVVPDAALRDAITEAVKLAGFGDAGDSADLATALKDADAAAIILDEASADKKALKALQDIAHGAKSRFVFFSWANPIPNGRIIWRWNPFRSHYGSGICLHAHISFAHAAAITERCQDLRPWRLELQNRQIVHQEDATVIRLTEKEAALLDYLAQSEEPVGREELLAAVWGHDGRIDTHTLETHIYQLRRKLDPDGEGVKLLINEQGAYRLKNL